MKIMDCTLRDGGNVIGAGFPAELTTLMLKGLTENGVKNVVATPLYLSDEYGIPSVAEGDQAQTTLSPTALTISCGTRSRARRRVSGFRAPSISPGATSTRT